VVGELCDPDRVELIFDLVRGFVPTAIHVLPLRGKNSIQMLFRAEDNIVNSIYPSLPRLIKNPFRIAHKIIEHPREFRFFDG
jgi:hypothetical protein